MVAPHSCRPRHLTPRSAGWFRQGASLSEPKVPMCHTQSREAFLTGTPKPPSCYQERVWTDAKEKEEKARVSRGGQTRARQDSSGWARLFEEPRVAGTEPAMGEAWSGGTNRALLPSPRPLPFVRNPAVLRGWGLGRRSRLAWRSPWAPAADWPVAQAAAGQARSWPRGQSR